MISLNFVEKAKLESLVSKIFVILLIAMMGKSPAAEKDPNSKEYEEIVKKTRYDPIDDAIWKQGQKTPYLAFAKTLQAIEATSGRMKTIEILSNYFRYVKCFKSKLAF